MNAQAIIPFIWFNGRAEEAAEFYVSLFPESRIGAISRYGKEGFEFHGQPEGTPMVIDMELGGTRVSILNGGPAYEPNPAVSFFVQLETEAEVDALWAALLDGGTVLMDLEPQPWSPKYGWLNDRYGVSWQISLGPKADVNGQTITPYLTFVGEQFGMAEEAVNLYTGIFPNSRVEGFWRADGSGAEAEGSVMHAQFYLNGVTFMISESAHPHEFSANGAISFMVYCDTQEEIDHYWSALTADGGAEQACGWLNDRFGVCWQIIPSAMDKLMTGPKAGAVMQAMFGMRKLDIAALEAAAKG